MFKFSDKAKNLPLGLEIGKSIPMGIDLGKKLSAGRGGDMGKNYPIGHIPIGMGDMRDNIPVREMGAINPIGMEMANNMPIGITQTNGDVSSFTFHIKP